MLKAPEQRIRWLIVATLVLFVLATNRWFSWDGGIDYLGSTDGRDYETIARAAFGLPTTLVPFHKMQRFPLHYLLGGLSHLSGAGLPVVYALGLAALLFTTLACLVRALESFGLGRRKFALLMALFVLNPYVFRFFLIAPITAQDLLFVAGSSAMLLGLVEARVALVLAGAATAALGRQTALVLLPGMTLWMVCATTWAARPLRRRLFQSGAVSATVIAIYFLLGAVARPVSAANLTSEHVLGLFQELAAGELRLGALAELTLRLLIPYALAGGLLAALARKKELARPETLACLLNAALVTAQPFLAGPQLTGRNASRLSSFGLLWVVAALAMASRNQDKFFENRRLFGVALACATAASFHHMYTLFGPASAARFCAIQFALALLLGGMACVAATPRGTR